MYLGIDPTAIEGFAKVLREAPDVLLRELAKGYQAIGRYDISTLDLSHLNIRSRGLRKSFKSKGTDPKRAADFSKLFATEYTGWKAARIFETGGVVKGKGKQLTILTEAARNASGRRKFSQRQLRQMVADGRADIINTPRGTLIVQHIGGYTKTGKARKGTRDVILAVLKKQITQRKRLDFFENAQHNQSMHQDILETAVENALVEIAGRMGS